MKTTLQTRRYNQGFLLILAVILIVIMGMVIAAAVTSFSKAISFTTASSVNGSVQQSGGQAALATAAAKLLTPVLSERSTCTSLNNSQFTINGTPFTITTQYTTSPNYTATANSIDATQLSSPMTNTQTYLCLNKTPFTNLPKAGVGGIVRVGNELMSYNSVSSGSSLCPKGSYACTTSNCPALLGVVRGINGTQALAHAQMAWVNQKQCDLTATQNNNTQNVTNASVGDLESGWIVGNQLNGQISLLRWNCNLTSGSSCATLSNQSTVNHSNAWTAYTITSPPTNTNYNTVVSTGQANWILGNNGTIAFFNGVGFTNYVPPTALPVTRYTSAYCNNDNDCWAGGEYVANASKNPTLIRYAVNTSVTNTANWFPLPMTNPTNASFQFFNTTGSSQQNIRGITCNPNTTVSTDPNATLSKDCWAVGDAVANVQYIWHWNGTFWTQYQVTAQDSGNRPVLMINLYSVSCVSPAQCYAVGDGMNGNGTAVWGIIRLPQGSTLATGTGRAFVATWVSAGATDTNIQSLRSIFCQSQVNAEQASCWIVGDSVLAIGHPIIFKLTGLSTSGTTSTGTAVWSQVTPAINNFNRLWSVNCINTANNCWAVGWGGTLLHWDGTSWTTQTSGTTAQLNAISLSGSRSVSPIYWQN